MPPQEKQKQGVRDISLLLAAVLNKYGRVRGIERVPSGASHDSHTGGDEENKREGGQNSIVVEHSVIAKFVEALLLSLYIHVERGYVCVCVPGVLKQTHTRGTPA